MHTELELGTPLGGIFKTILGSESSSGNDE
jgi:hypothetical protein